MPTSYHKNNMIYIIKQEELYQNMVNSNMVKWTIRKCAMSAIMTLLRTM